MRPARENFRQSGQTYFVSSQTIERQPFFRHERWAVLLQEVLHHYRGTSYLLHAHVIMPDHFHILLSPLETLERAMQKIKGGFSFRARSTLQWRHNIWQVGFSDHRIRDSEDFERHVTYIQNNPLKHDHRYIEVNLDPLPQRLKPLVLASADGGAKAPPLKTRSLGRRRRSLQPSRPALHFRNPGPSPSQAARKK